MKKFLLFVVFSLFLLPFAVMGQCGSNALKATDADGNSYASLKVGPHCWTQFNLKTKAEGSFIYKSDMYPDTTANLSVYGRLYNWYTAMNVQPDQTPVVGEHNFVQGICPEGWHLPNDDEVAQLMTNTTPALHDVHYWLVPGTNTTNYTMRPGGYYNAIMNRSENLCGDSYMWTAKSLDESSPSIVWSDCHCDYSLIDRTAANNGMSVRCVYRIYQGTVTTDPVTNITDKSATLYGTVAFNGYDEEYERGFVYGTSSDNLDQWVVENQAASEATAPFNKEITGLSAATTYYYQAYVVNDFDTAWGEIKDFTTLRMQVSTDSANTITHYAATLHGNLIHLDYASVNAGFKYGTGESALTSISEVYTLSNLGQYSATLEGLAEGTTYFFKAFAANGTDTVYGEVKNFTTLTDVVTDTIAFVPNGGQGAMDTMFVTRGDTVLNANTYTHGGNWHFDGWNTAADGSGTQYADQDAITTNGNLTLYAQWHTWCTGIPKTSVNEFGTSRIDSVKDIDNNKYNVVQIGNQCWMAQNLRTTKYADGTAIVKGGSAMSRVMPYRYFPDDDTNNVNTYGHLYNWMAVMNGAESSSANPSGVQGICPDGWHVPSNAEWNTLTQYVYNSDDPDYKCSSCESSGWIEATKCIGKALASTTGWDTKDISCAVGNDLSDNNATGFSAVPAGGVNASGNSAFFGQITSFWSATYEATPNKVHARNLYYTSGNVNSSGVNDLLGFSVRCLRDPMSVTTDSANTVTNNGATLYGNVKSLGKYATVKAGFRYGTSDSTMTTKVDKTVNTYGSYLIDINNLSPNTTYYFQAYAYNETDTVYGKVMDFYTASDKHCPGIYTVADHEGNIYNTVQIGSQCWMAQNMRCTTSPNGLLQKGETGSSSSSSPPILRLSR